MRFLKKLFSTRRTSHKICDWNTKSIYYVFIDFFFQNQSPCSSFHCDPHNTTKGFTTEISIKMMDTNQFLVFYYGTSWRKNGVMFPTRNITISRTQEK
jgi:hypothetical protein